MTEFAPGAVSAAPFDFRDPGFRANPYPYLARLRQEAPVCPTPLGFWLVSRYEDVNGLNRDRRLGRDLRQWHDYERVRPYLADSPLEGCVEQWLFSLDGAAHTRLRRLFARAFTPRIINSMRPQIAAAAAELLAEAAGAAQFDFMSQFAQPFPVRVITRLLDLPAGDYHQLKAWSDDLVPVVEPVSPRAVRQKASAAAAAMVDYLRRHLGQYGRRDTFLGELLAAVAEEGALNESELTANLVFLFIAGHETTTNLLGNGLLALLRYPAQLARLRAEPRLLPAAVEELLRYDGPANVNARVTYEPIVIGGQALPAGSLVFGLLGAANHDPDIFTNPDELDIGRQPNPHLTFGGGPHYCLGAPLARLEAGVALDQILRRWPQIAVDEGGVVWRDLVNVRGLERLPIVVSG